MPDSVVYRVTFSGDRLPDEIDRELNAAGVALEGCESGVDTSRHRVLVRGSSCEEAMRTVRDALPSWGHFAGFVVEPVRDVKGRLWRREFYRHWDEIDWHVRERATLGELQRATMRALADAAEPTVLVARSIGRSARVAENALLELREKGLVARHTEPFWEGEEGDDEAEWWKLTDEAWDLLGLIKSPGYH